MVSSVGSTIPYSYYNILNPQAPLTVPAGTPGGSSSSSGSTGTGNSTLSGGSGVQLSSDVIGLLQQLLGGGSSTDPLDSLLGGNSNSGSGGTLASLLGTSQLSGRNLLSGIPEGQILSQAYASALSAAVSGTTLAVADQSANGNTTLQSALSAYQAAFNAGHPNPPMAPSSTTS